LTFNTANDRWPDLFLTPQEASPKTGADSAANGGSPR